MGLKSIEKGVYRDAVVDQTAGSAGTVLESKMMTFLVCTIVARASVAASCEIGSFD